MKPIPMRPAPYDHPARAEGMMNDSTRVMRRPRRAWPAWPAAARTAAAIIAAAAMVVLAACSSPSSTGSSTGPGGSPTAGGSADAGESANAQLLAFSQCMRSRGVPNFPDPQAGASNAKFPGAQQLRVSSSQLSTAENACQRLLPVGIDDQFPPAEVPLVLRGMLPFARCMRSHGVPNFPDPAVDSEGRPIFPLSAHGISLDYSHSRRFTAVIGECQHLVPQQLGGIPFG